MEKKPLTGTDDEIDLLFYADKILQGLKKYLRILGRNLLLFLFIVLVITGAAFSLRYVIPPAYCTNGLFISYFLPANYYATMIQDLDQMLDKKNLPLVAEQLQLTPGVVSTIQGIKLEALRDTSLDKGDMVFAPFSITLVLKDMRHLDSIQYGILIYLHGGMDLYQKNHAKSKLLQQTRDELYQQLTLSDTIAGINRSRAGIYEQIARNDDLLKQAQRIDVVRPFLRRTNHNYPNYGRYLILGFIASVILALILTPILGRR